MTDPTEDQKTVKAIGSAINLLIEVQSLNKIEGVVFLQAISQVTASTFMLADVSREQFLSIMATTWDMTKDFNAKPS